MAKKKSQFCRCTSEQFTTRNVAKEETYPRDSCSDAWRKGGLGGRWLQQCCMAVRQQEQYQHHRRSLRWLCFADASRLHPKQVGWCLWVPWTSWIGSALESSSARRTLLLHESLGTARLTKAAITKPGSTSTSLGGAPKDPPERTFWAVPWRQSEGAHISHSEPYHYGKQERHFSDVMSDHSLSSL